MAEKRNRRRTRSWATIPVTPSGIRVEASVRVPLESLAPLSADQLTAFMAGVGAIIRASSNVR
jgi:hypothetical protein